MMPGARKRARGPVRSRWLQGSEPLEPRRALAVTATAFIDSFVMPIGSAAQLVVVGQPASPVSAQSGDFDGDLSDDFAWIDATGGVWVNRSLGVALGTAPQLWGRLPSDVRWESITVRDFTGDGRADIAARNARNGNWRLLRSDGIRFSDPQRFGNWSPAVAWQHVVAGDFDGNGSADLAARDPASGEWWVSRSTGTRFDRPRVIGSGSLLIGSGTSGITSSAAAASGGGRTVGWIDNGNASATGFAFAAAGDTNLDWKVDIVDAASFLAGGKFDSGTPASRNQGDFTYDGVVDIFNAADFHHS